MDTYRETVLRYVVEYLEDLPDAHKAELRLYGIDPDDNWQLQWSFNTYYDALRQKLREARRHADFCSEHGYKVRKTWRVRDLGEAKQVERLAIF